MALPHRVAARVLLGMLVTALGASSPANSGERLVALARAAVVAEVRGLPAPKASGGTPARGVFVTIETAGKVIGCRGTLTPRSRTLEEEIVLSARAAARHDPRYPPLRPEHLDDFKVTVTLVDRLEAISRVDGLLPEHGLVLASGSRSGIVLPWEGKEPSTRLKWAYLKAGVPFGSSVRLQLLIGQRFRG